MRHRYLSKAIAHEYSKMDIAVNMSLIENDMDLEGKYNLFMNLSANNKKTPNMSLYSQTVNDDNFYNQMSEDIVSETDGYIKISDDPIDETTIDEDENTALVQEAGGIAFSKVQILEMAEEEAMNMKARAIKLKATVKWGKEIPYRLEGISSDKKSKILKVMRDIETIANNKIKFVEIEDSGKNRTLWTLGLNYHVRIFNHDGISSLGKGPWAFVGVDDNEDTMRHELMHLLGFLHEQQRYDRDSYVKVNYDQIPYLEHAQYIKWEKEIGKYFYITIKIFKWKKTIRIGFAIPVSETWGSFDFDSIMLYSSAIGTKGGRKIVKKDGSLIYDKKDFSETDKEAIRSVYK